MSAHEECTGCRCVMPPPGIRCPCCQHMSARLLCVDCGEEGDVGDMLLLSSGPSHDRCRRERLATGRSEP